MHDVNHADNKCVPVGCRVGWGRDKVKLIGRRMNLNFEIQLL